MDYLVTFHTHLDAIEYVKYIKNEKNIVGRLKPVPRALSAACGTCVTFTAEENENDLFLEGCEKIFIVSNNNMDKYKLFM